MGPGSPTLLIDQIKYDATSEAVSKYFVDNWEPQPSSDKTQNMFEHLQMFLTILQNK